MESQDRSSPGIHISSMIHLSHTIHLSLGILSSGIHMLVKYWDLSSGILRPGSFFPRLSGLGTKVVGFLLPGFIESLDSDPSTENLGTRITGFSVLGFAFWDS
jgi:hypothetical protein